MTAVSAADVAPAVTPNDEASTAWNACVLIANTAASPSVTPPPASERPIHRSASHGRNRSTAASTPSGTATNDRFVATMRTTYTVNAPAEALAGKPRPPASALTPCIASSAASCSATHFICCRTSASRVRTNRCTSAATGSAGVANTLANRSPLSSADIPSLIFSKPAAHATPPATRSRAGSTSAAQCARRAQPTATPSGKRTSAWMTNGSDRMSRALPTSTMAGSHVSIHAEKNVRASAPPNAVNTSPRLAR